MNRNYSVVESKPITVEVFGHRYLGAGGSSSGGAVVAGILNYLAGFSEPLVSAGGIQNVSNVNDMLNRPL